MEDDKSDSSEIIFITDKSDSFGCSDNTDINCTSDSNDSRDNILNILGSYSNDSSDSSYSILIM